MVINFITKCFSKANSELCFNIVEIFSPYLCTCQEAWQAIWFLTRVFFKRSQVRVGLWWGSGTSLPAGAVQCAGADLCWWALGTAHPCRLSRGSPCRTTGPVRREELAAPGGRCPRSSSAELGSLFAEEARQCWRCWGCQLDWPVPKRAWMCTWTTEALYSQHQNTEWSFAIFSF